VLDEHEKKLFTSTVRLLCKPTSWSEKGHMIKIPLVHSDIIPVLAKMFRRAHWCFMYRDGLKVCVLSFTFAHEDGRCRMNPTDGVKLWRHCDADVSYIFSRPRRKPRLFFQDRDQNFRLFARHIPRLPPRNLVLVHHKTNESLTPRLFCTTNRFNVAQLNCTVSTAKHCGAKT